MAHGTEQAVAGLGDGSVIGTGGNVADADNRLASLASVFDIEASEVDVADAGGYTATTDLESAIQEIYSRLPYTIDQGSDLVIDTTVGDGSTLRTTSMVAPVLASTKYVVEAYLVLTGSANSGWKFSFDAPSAATMIWQATSFDAADSVLLSAEKAVGDSYGATAAAAVQQFYVQGVLTVDTTAGNLSVFAAQNVDHADDFTVHEESWLRVTKAA
jgi:hypothetical protein